MRVILIAPPPPAAASGNERSVRRLAAGLAARGHDVRCLTPTEALALAREAARGMARTPAAPPIDLVHVYHAFRAATPADFVVGGRRAARVVTFAGSDLPGLPLADLQRAVIADEVARADAAMVAFDEQRAAVEAEWPTLAGRVFVVRKGVVAPTGDFPLRARAGFFGDERVALLAAGVRPVKGTLRAIDWFADVVAREPRARLVLVGPELDAEYARDVRALLARTPWAHWLGAVLPDQMGGVFAGADAVINVSDYEGQSNALLEALALGRPVVAHHAPGNREWLRDGEQALLFHDRAGFAAATTAALRRDPQVLAIAARGPAWVAAHHDPAREIDELEALYQRALDRRGAAPR